MGTMARRVRVQSLIALSLLLLVASSAGSGVVAHYTFDSDDLATGPDTFAVFEKAKGRVDLAGDIRYSGYNSVVITDVSNDGDFPELQGYFSIVDSGVLHFRFAILIATPGEPLNVALAGPGGFGLQKDAMAIWLKTTRDGWLRHVSDGIPKKLFQPRPFAWYVVEIRYALDRGTYDLSIHEEGRKDAVAALRDQPNATSTANSAVGMFSFVGSVFEDDSNVRYYVDDIAVATSDGKAAPFVAPGRRKLFVDRWRDTVKHAAANKGCPPVLDFDDVGVTASEAAEARARINSLQAACATLGEEATLRELDARAASWPRATAYTLASIVALTRQNRWAEAEARWAAAAPALRHDIRYGWMAALLGMHRQNWDEAEAWLRVPADELAVLEKDRERKLIAEEYYFVLLWKSEHAAAARYAERVAARLAAIGVDASWWRTRAGDAELLGGRLGAARAHYEAARNSANDWTITERLADIAHLEGDAERERTLRERLYGALR